MSCGSIWFFVGLPAVVADVVWAEVPLPLDMLPPAADAVVR